MQLWNMGNYNTSPWVADWGKVCYVGLRLLCITGWWGWGVTGTVRRRLLQWRHCQVDVLLRWPLQHSSTPTTTTPPGNRCSAKQSVQWCSAPYWPNPWFLILTSLRTLGQLRVWAKYIIGRRAVPLQRCSAPVPPVTQAGIADAWVGRSVESVTVCLCVNPNLGEEEVVGGRRWYNSKDR